MNFTEIDVHKRDRERRARQRTHGKMGWRIGVAYIDGVRPMETGGSIVDDLIWRRTEAGKPPLKNKQMFELIKDKLAPWFVTLTRVVYSRYAGCSCPCSPGYILYGTVNQTAFHQEITTDRWNSPWRFGIQDHEFGVYVSTPEYKIAQEQKAQEKSGKRWRPSSGRISNLYNLEISCYNGFIKYGG
jgi:hypothetical protein